MLLYSFSRLPSTSALTIGWDFFKVFTSWFLCFPTVMVENTMDNTFGTNTLASAVKAEVENLLLWMLLALFLCGNSWELFFSIEVATIGCFLNRLLISSLNSQFWTFLVCVPVWWLFSICWHISGRFFIYFFIFVSPFSCVIEWTGVRLSRNQFF